MRGYDPQSPARRWWQWQHAITANGCWQASAQLFQSVTFSESGWDRGSLASSSFRFPNHSILLHSVATTALYPQILLVHIFISSHLHQSHSLYCSKNGFVPPLLQSYHCLTISLSLFYACLLNTKSQQSLWAVDTSTCSACCSCQALQAERGGQTHQHTPHSGGTLWEVLWPEGAVHERNS